MCSAFWHVSTVGPASMYKLAAKKSLTELHIETEPQVSHHEWKQKKKHKQLEYKRNSDSEHQHYRKMNLVPSHSEYKRNSQELELKQCLRA